MALAVSAAKASSSDFNEEYWPLMRDAVENMSVGSVDVDLQKEIVNMVETIEIMNK